MAAINKIVTIIKCGCGVSPSMRLIDTNKHYNVVFVNACKKVIRYSTYYVPTAGALVSPQFEEGTLLSALNSVLTTKRRLQLKIRALTAHEIATQLSCREPVYAEHEAAAESWWSKTPLERRRQKVLQRLIELEQENEEKKAAAK